MLLIGGYTPDKGEGAGIAVVDDDRVVATVPTGSPSWIARHPALPVLYAVDEAADGGVAAWTLVDGAPAAPLGTGRTGGADPCHLAVDATGGYLVTVNYTGGSVSVHRLGADGSIGERTDLLGHQRHGEHPRQRDGAHPHMAHVDGDGLLVVDLGGDAIYRYVLDGAGRLRLDRMVGTPPHTGPRHLLPVEGRWYVTTELAGELLTFDADWQLLGAEPVTASAADNLAAEVAASGDGRFLYVSNRGPDTVSVFALDGGLPRYLTEVPTGRWPRHIAVDGDLLYVAAERSHQVEVMRIDPATGVPAPVTRIATPSPTCVLP
jgi:6-phosphogluconolactonase